MTGGSGADHYTLLLEDGSWILVRASGTEPKLRVYAETPDGDRLVHLLDSARNLVEPLVERAGEA
jgi:phosphomannomutase